MAGGHQRDGDVADPLRGAVVQHLDPAGLERLLHDELPYVPLWYEDHVAAYRDEVLERLKAIEARLDTRE